MMNWCALGLALSLFFSATSWATEPAAPTGADDFKRFIRESGDLSVKVRCVPREQMNRRGIWGYADVSRVNGKNLGVMVLTREACRLFGFRNGQSYRGADFRNRTQCQSFSLEKIRAHAAENFGLEAGSDDALKQFTDSCCGIRHKYAHIIDPR